MATLQAAVLREVGSRPHSKLSVLDVGCGNGATVKAWLNLGADAHGCDFSFKPGPDVDDLTNQKRITAISTAPYRLPYPDESFDVVLTNQVMEHVRDYRATLAEMRRVLKPDGYCLHTFPARYVPIEPHIFVPFATVLQARWWLALWALLGVRKSTQQGAEWRKVADDNLRYLQRSTNYLTGRELRRNFTSHFGNVRYVERSFLKNSPNPRGRLLYRAASALPPLFLLYRVFWSRVILARP